MGDFPLEKAYSIEEIKAEIEKTENEEYSFVNKAEDYLSHVRRYQLNPARQKAFCNGLSSNDYKFEGSEQALLVYSNDVFLGVGRYDSKNKSIVPVKILL